ncbi:MAG: iron ABC transporter permease [Nitrospirae bacterium]|nr:iron ABC transporter permease [Nitrospirota bacterium]
MSHLSRKRWTLTLAGFVGLSAGAVLLALFMGPESITPVRGMQFVSDWMKGGGRTLDDAMGIDAVGMILFQIRLPRILLAWLSGGALAITGAALQALLRNPLADPYLLGISSGGALGAAVMILWNPGQTWFTAVTSPLLAFAGGLLVLFFVYRLGLWEGKLSVPHLLLAGVAVNAVIASLILFITAMVDPVKTSRIVFWLMGNLHSPPYVLLVPLSGYLLIGMGVLVFYSKELNLLLLGEETAQSLGVDVERLKRIVFMATALLTGAVVSFVGPVAFVGLLVPHILRLWLGMDNRLLIPASILGGGSFLILVDVLARTLMSPAEIPVGAVTALCGGIVFLYLLRMRKQIL